MQLYVTVVSISLLVTIYNMVFMAMVIYVITRESFNTVHYDYHVDLRIDSSP
jgi:hypothetical protein